MTDLETFDAYQAEVARTMPKTPPPSGCHLGAIFALGVAGEAGEVAELVKKYYGHGASFEKTSADLVHELGDVLWYVTALGASFGIPLSEIVEANSRKLRARYPDGFELGGGVR